MNKVQTSRQPKQPCANCKKNVTPKQHPGLSCFICGKFFHFACVQIDKTAENSIAALQLSWCCTSCKKKPNNRRSTIVPSEDPVDLPNAPVAPQLSIEKRFEELLEAFLVYRRTTDERIASLENKLVNSTTTASSLSNCVKSVEERAEDLERISLEKSLEIQGIPDAILADPQQAASLVAQSIDYRVTEEIECLAQACGTRKLLKVNFSSKSARNAFLIAGKTFNKLQKRICIEGENHKIFVNEPLTKYQKILLYDAKVFTRDRNYKCAWFVNGQRRPPDHHSNSVAIGESTQR